MNNLPNNNRFLGQMDIERARNPQQMPTLSYQIQMEDSYQMPIPMPAPYQLRNSYHNNLNKMGEVRVLAQETNNKFSERDEALKKLEESSEALNQNARIFANQGKEVKELIANKAKRMMVLIGVIGLVLIALLIFVWVTTSRYDPQQYSAQIYADAREAGRVEGLEAAKEEINQLRIQVENLSSSKTNRNGVLT